MQQTTVGTKHQIVIPRDVRKAVRGLEPGNKVVVKRLDENTLLVHTEPASWVERNFGLMKNAWKNTDTTKLVKDLRNEWDRKY